ncbi:antibiotic biosynthesis monooxygenase [Limimaricola pyoseonensis]|uniref:Autoinducer 2-degrading protein n=1 Tax=Limimaricola pyoseonensis TaxID=521013 RepID=A0A1G7ILR6_9RHOB|nr:antibiotic biosynthesis monooxygenase [Limimaricola pyoseonensis]SDF13466.1 autoinducer 2-degrading protein [Limimaricola pyoseonensis]
MLIQLVNIRVAQGERETFLEAFRINCEGTRKEPGNIRFDLLCDPEDDHNFSVYEIFESAAALDRHRETEHYRRCVAMIEPITLGGRSKTYFEPVLIQDQALA